MKKFLLFIVFIIAFCLTSNGADVYTLSNLGYDGVYSCYVQDVVNIPSYFRVDQNGAGKIVSSDMKVAGEIKNYISGRIYGESICFEGTYDDFVNVINDLNIKVVERESMGELECVYGFGKFGEHVVINGRAVNVQIAYSLGNITIGCPIILGSY